MRVGLDFGTSNSTWAIAVDGSAQLLPLDPASPDPRVVPTLLYLRRDGGKSIGREALTEFGHANAGHEARMVRQKVAVIENIFAEVGTTYTDIYVWVDEREPGRLFKSLKMQLPRANYKGTAVFGKPYAPEQLIAEYLIALSERAKERSGEDIERIVIGRPVHYDYDPEGDKLAEQRMRAACALAGFAEAEFQLEPVGAALSYAQGLAHDQTALVFDFGGGTLDLTVLELHPSGKYQVLATAGIPIGGDALDRRIMQRRLLKNFGVDASARIDGLPLPARVAEALLSWQTMPQLLEPVNASLWERLRTQRGSYGRRYRALECLVHRNYGLPLFEAIERAKVELSSSEHTHIDFAAEAIVLNEALSRGEFEEFIATEIRECDACVGEVLLAAGLEAAAIDVVVRTGGSSAIPAIERSLFARFGPEKVLPHELFTGVAAGLAIAAAG